MAVRKKVPQKRGKKASIPQNPVLVIDEIQHKLDIDSFEAVCKHLPDISENTPVFDILADSKLDKIRALAAEKTSLSREKVQKLWRDDSEAVINALIQNSTAMQSFSSEDSYYLVENFDDDVLAPLLASEEFQRTIDENFFDLLIDSERVDIILQLLDDDNFMNCYCGAYLERILQFDDPEIISKLSVYTASDNFIASMDEAGLFALIATGESVILRDIAAEITAYAFDFNIADVDSICEALLEADDPEVNLLLIENYDVPEEFVEALAENSDKKVAKAARKRLEGD